MVVVAVAVVKLTTRESLRFLSLSLLSLLLSHSEPRNDVFSRLLAVSQLMTSAKRTNLLNTHICMHAFRTEHSLHNDDEHNNDKDNNSNDHDDNVAETTIIIVTT